MLMILYLMRHAHAVSEYEDSCRPLSDRGRAQTRIMGEHFHAHDALRASTIWHSPLERARQTAGLFNRCASLGATCQEVDGLLPFDDVGDIARRLSASEDPVVLVGHEPHLGHLVSLLVSGIADRGLIDFKKGGICCLKPANARLWSIKWYLTPKTATRARNSSSPTG